MDLATAEQVVLNATRQAKVHGGLGWIDEGRPLRGQEVDQDRHAARVTGADQVVPDLVPSRGLPLYRKRTKR